MPNVLLFLYSEKFIISHEIRKTSNLKFESRLLSDKKLKKETPYCVYFFLFTLSA